MVKKKNDEKDLKFFLQPELVDIDTQERSPECNWETAASK